MATAAPATFNPAYLIDPSLYGDQQAIGQQQALAQALLQGGMSPMPETQMAGNVALRNSPTQSIAKLVQLLSGQDMQRQVNQANQSLGQRQFAANMQNVGGYGQPGQGQDPRGSGSIPRLGGDSTGVMSAMLLNQDPARYAELSTGQNAPSDLDKQLAGQGIYPGDPRYTDAKAKASFKGTYQQPYEVRPDQVAVDPRTQTVVGNNPKTPEGFVNDYSIGSAVSTGQSPVNGGLRAITASKGAQQANDVVDVPLPNGQTQKMTKGQFLSQVGGGNTPYSFDVAPGTEGRFRDALVKSGDPGALAAFDAKYGNQMPGMTTGQTTANKEASLTTGKSVAERNQAVIADANQAPQDIENLNGMLKLAQSANFGPGASTAAKWKALAAQIPGMGLIVNPTTLQDQQANVTIMKKYAADMAARNGTRSDAALQTELDRIPGDAAPDAAIKQLVPMLLARRVARMDEAKIRQGLGGDQEAIQKFETQWRGAYDPLAYEATLATRGMNDAQVSAYIKSHYTPTQAGDIAKSRAALRDMGVKF